MKKKNVTVLRLFSLFLLFFFSALLGPLWAFEDDYDSNGKSGQLTVAFSWLPGFCSVEKYQSKKECRSLRDNPKKSHSFVLHGLWPDGSVISKIHYCGDSKNLEDYAKSSDNWCSSKMALNLPTELKAKLLFSMPGVLSCLHRYQYHKHGSCYSNSSQEYFNDSILILHKINFRSSSQDIYTDFVKFINEKRGESLSVDQIKKKFLSSFNLTDLTLKKLKVICN